MNCRELATCTFLVVAVLSTSTSSSIRNNCPSGRIFVGNVGSSLPEIVPFNGVYATVGDRPEAETALYRHEHRKDLFISYVTGSTNAADSRWEISRLFNNGSSIAGQNDVVRLVSFTGGDGTRQSDADDVTSVSRVWLARDVIGVTRTVAVKVTCVSEEFAMCSCDGLLVSGLSARHRRVQGRRQGLFMMTSCTNQLRPVYKHRRRNEYLFFADGVWVVGPSVGRISGGFLVNDSAWRPEFILNKWDVFLPVSRGFERDDTLSVTCIRRQAVVNSDGLQRSGKPVYDVIRRPITLAINADLLRHQANRSRTCNGQQQGGNSECRDGRRKQCQALEGDSVKQCDSATSFNITLPVVASSGFSSLDTVFYRCPSESVPTYTGRVCQPDGTWSDLYPGCAEAPTNVLLTPEHPQLGRRRT